MPPTRVQGKAGEAGAASLALSLTGVVAGDVILVWFASLGNSGGSTVTNTGGGIYHQVDTVSSPNGVEQGYITGASGTTSVTMGFSGGAATTGCVEEITPATLDQHNFISGQSVTGGTTLARAITTTAVDYCFSGAVDAVGNGGSAQSVASPYTVRDTNATFPIADADSTQSSAGLITATWTFNVTTTGAAVGVMSFSSAASGNPGFEWQAAFPSYGPGYAI